MLPTIEDILAARDRILSHVMNTPCLPSATLSRIAGYELHLKFENLQFTASFKERGALNKLLTLEPPDRAGGVCAVSAGNHAQGVAYHAARLGIPATIVMPLGAPMTKIARTRDHGATVIIAGPNLAEAFAVAERGVAQSGQTRIHPYDDADVIAGQGTLGLEIVEQVEMLDAILVPIGGGGLISGVALAAKAIQPDIQVIGVQSRAYPSMVRAMAGEAPVASDRMTIAEGIAVKAAGILTREIARLSVDNILLVEESSIERAVALLQSVEKTVVEGAGAARAPRADFLARSRNPAHIRARGGCGWLNSSGWLPFARRIRRPLSGWAASFAARYCAISAGAPKTDSIWRTWFRRCSCGSFVAVAPRRSSAGTSTPTCSRPPAASSRIAFASA